MTLIAAFKINNVPFVLADMLITNDPAPTQPQFVPLSPNRISPPNGRAPVGAVSKLLVLNGRLAIAFAGSVAAGTKLFSDLHRRFSNSTPSEDALSGALKSWNVDKIISKQARVVGWLATPEPRCFEWAAGPGATVNFVSQAFQGSGASHFEREILPRRRSGMGDLTDREAALFFAVTKANRILVDEMTKADGLANYYGYSLEIAFWKDTAFEFQNKMVSIFMDAIILDNGQFSTRPVSVRIYERHPRYALIQTCNSYEHKGPDGIPGQHMFLELITPLHDNGDEIAWDQQPLDPASSIYTFNIAVRTATKSGMMYLTLGPDEVRVEGDRKKFSIVITNQGAIEDIRNSLN
jgi:hypothetical protein